SPRFRPLGEAPPTTPARILHVGHCGPYKNIERVLHALPLVCEHLGRPVEFVKVGAPFSTPQQALIDKLGLQQQVRHLGRVSMSDLPRVYSEAGLLLMPSLYEGFGLP